MIIHADYNMGHLYVVWDCDVCNYINTVKWVDDVKNEYCITVGYNRNLRQFIYKSVKAKILIIPEIRLIFINPKETKEQLLNEFTDIIIEGIG